MEDLIVKWEKTGLLRNIPDEQRSALAQSLEFTYSIMPKADEFDKVLLPLVVRLYKAGYRKCMTAESISELRTLYREALLNSYHDMIELDVTMVERICNSFLNVHRPVTMTKKDIIRKTIQILLSKCNIEEVLRDLTSCCFEEDRTYLIDSLTDMIDEHMSNDRNSS